MKSVNIKLLFVKSEALPGWVNIFLFQNNVFLSSWHGIEHDLPSYTCAMQLNEVQRFLNWLRPCEFLDGSGVTGQKVVVLLGTG